MISDPDPAPDLVLPLFHTKLKNMFLKCSKSEKIHQNFIHNAFKIEEVQDFNPFVSS